MNYRQRERERERTLSITLDPFQLQVHLIDSMSLSKSSLPTSDLLSKSRTFLCEPPALMVMLPPPNLLSSNPSRVQPGAICTDSMLFLQDQAPPGMRGTPTPNTSTPKSVSPTGRVHPYLDHQPSLHLFALYTVAQALTLVLGTFLGTV